MGSRTGVLARGVAVMSVAPEAAVAYEELDIEEGDGDSARDGVGVAESKL